MQPSSPCFPRQRLQHPLLPKTLHLTPHEQGNEELPLVTGLDLLLPGMNINAHVRRQQPATPASQSLYFNTTAGCILSQVSGAGVRKEKLDKNQIRRSHVLNKR